MSVSGLAQERAHPRLSTALPFVATPEDIIRRAGPLAAIQTFQKEYNDWFFGYYVAGEPLISHVHVLTVNSHI